MNLTEFVLNLYSLAAEHGVEISIDIGKGPYLANGCIRVTVTDGIAHCSQLHDPAELAELNVIDPVRRRFEEQVMKVKAVAKNVY